MRAPLSIRRFAIERLTVVLLALALAVLAVAPGGTAQTPCTVRSTPAPMLTTAAFDRPAAATAEERQPKSGIDLTLRVWNLRVEFPWMRALPVSPGHHIVISLFARGPE